MSIISIYSSLANSYTSGNINIEGGGSGSGSDTDHVNITEEEYNNLTDE